MTAPTDDNGDRPRIYRLLAYLFVGAVAALGLLYVQDIAQEAHDTATNFAASERREDAEEDQEREDNCLVRNRAVSNGRERFQQFSENVSVLFGRSGSLTPEEREQIQAILFKDINFDPAAEDLDCNEDGKLDEEDYAP